MHLKGTFAGHFAAAQRRTSAGNGRHRPEFGAFDQRALKNVAPLVVWLGSPESRGVTGQVFLVGGGRIGVVGSWQRGPMIDKGPTGTRRSCPKSFPPCSPRLSPNT